MNLSQLRDLVLDLRAWNSSGTTFDQRLNKAINLAYRKMSKDVPEVLVPSFESHYVFKDQTTTATKAYLYPTDDPWVLEFRDQNTLNLAHGSSTVTWRPQTNATWDGLMHVEITDPDGTVQRFRCREFWSVGGAASETWYVSLDRPFQPTTSDTTLRSFRIHQPSIYLKSDYIRVVDAAAWDGDYENDQLSRLDVGLVDRHKLRDFRGQNNGTPTAVFQNRNEQLRGPSTAPGLVKTGATPWSTTYLPDGDFTFKYTYIWGSASEKEGYPRRTPGGYTESVLESPPSPESSKFTIRKGEAPLITMAPIDNMLNFPTGAPKRAVRSGLRIRVYAARHSTVETEGGFTTSLAKWAADKKFYPIAEVNPVSSSSVGGVSFAWTGASEGLDSGIPDFYRPLSENHIYRGWSLYPHQDKDFRVDFRVLRPPEALVSDSDHSMVEPDAESSLIELVLYYLCLMDGADQAGAQVHLGNYANELRSVRSQHASQSGSVTPSTWDQAGTYEFNLGRYKEV